MARIRTIKPSFFRSEDVAVLPLRARLTWIGLWTHCDDAGRTKDNVRLIKADVWPLDNVSLRDVEEDLEVLAAHGRIVRYEVDGRHYLEITNWRDHQAIQKPSPSRLPPPPGLPPDSGSPTGTVPDASDTATGRRGEEGKGREGTRASAREPPSKCPEHLDDPTPPACGPCADARRHHERSKRDRAAVSARANSDRARGQADAARAAIAACRLCDEHGYRSGRPCPHDPDSEDRARRGMSTARAAISGQAGTIDRRRAT